MLLSMLLASNDIGDRVGLSTDCFAKFVSDRDLGGGGGMSSRSAKSASSLISTLNLPSNEEESSEATPFFFP